jgi:hypothetical protein
MHCHTTPSVGLTLPHNCMSSHTTATTGQTDIDKNPERSETETFVYFSLPSRVLILLLLLLLLLLLSLLMCSHCFDVVSLFFLVLMLSPCDNHRRWFCCCCSKELPDGNISLNFCCCVLEHTDTHRQKERHSGEHISECVCVCGHQNTTKVT